MTEDFAEEEPFDQLDLLIDFAVGMILRSSDPNQFLAQFADSAPHFAPGLAAQLMGSAQDKRAFFLNVGRLLWNRTPLPDNRFRPRPLPKPERNAPCPCGSGKKYKHCCAYTEDLPDLFQNVSLLLYVLRHIPAAQYKELPFSYLDPEEVAYVAQTWREGDDAKNAVKLLEPFLADPAHLDERAEPAFDTLIECYNDLGNPRKKARLIETFLRAPNRTLKSAALHRRITVVSDQGDFDEAWRLFHEAQRLEPDNPNLASLEIVLLQAQGKYEQARERGRFWIARLSREREHDYGDLIALLRELIETPDEVRFQATVHKLPDLDKLRTLVGKLPPPECHYRLHPQDDSAGRLEPSPMLAALVIDWRTRAHAAKPQLTRLQSGGDWEDIAPGIAWLEKHPLAWHNFDVLDDIILALDEVGPVGGTDAVLALPLLRHAEALLRLALRTNEAEGKRLEWGWLENRPALRLIATLIHTLLSRHQETQATPLLEWMVLTLNPNDNHGFRALLARLYLQRGDAQAALNVCERYPDDMASMQYNRALALHHLGRAQEATDALRAAKREYPEVLRMLLAAKAKQPRLSPYSVTVGGKDEAWLYREEHLDLWRADGALEWARSISGARQKR
jgi:tetratricopeptide (TPR) repeat protein